MGILAVPVPTSSIAPLGGGHAAQIAYELRVDRTVIHRVVGCGLRHRIHDLRFKNTLHTHALSPPKVLAGVDQEMEKKKLQT